ncbi:AraC-like DNA-binding protein [Paenibacillus phyllosphaerae]|uniref:AraC-like DNA-binding protein n=1 Tax=Paenibacillus phyllosphaerae TaxID=274593 RepID=A0A7W5B0G5_9BACL|nr:helix-turn-helix domain-containing protein [Paenibacillus phyllosphaerae]MBB3111631.1 AraC-like DNA-binding protein [Paenibacillus phyllosphaerae]
MTSWYKKQLLSYFPIFLMAITVIVLLGLVIVSDISRKETQKANRLSAQFISDTMVRALDEIETASLEELAANESVLTFTDQRESEEVDESLLMYGVSNALRALTDNNPLIHSVYLYRAEDRLMLTPNGKYRLDAFSDREFVEASLTAGRSTDIWSDVRNLRAPFEGSATPVISLVKRLPVPFGDRGLAVINADVRVLRQYIDETADDRVTYLDVVDERGDVAIASGSGESIADDVTFLSRIPIPNTKWTIRSGIQPGQLFAWFSLISYVWVAIGFATIVLSFGYIVYVAKRNYRPIEKMMNKLESIQLEALPDDRKVDDLSIIGQALERLIEQTGVYEQKRHESLVARRRQAFLDLLEGTDSIEEADWREGLPPVGREAADAGSVVIVAEIENAESFEEGTTAEDRSVMRLALQSFMQDAFGRGASSWTEWINGTRVGILCAFEAGETGRGGLLEAAESTRRWIEDNFRISFVFAIGTSTTNWRSLAESYVSAKEALDHKLTRVHDGVIVAEEVADYDLEDTIWYWTAAADIAKSFRLTQERWQSSLAELFDDFRSHRTKDREIYAVLETITKLLKKEIVSGNGTSETVAQAWWKIGIDRQVTGGKTLDQLEWDFTEALGELYRLYVAACENDSQQTVVIEMRNYIEANFANPDLSLKHLADRFGLAGKNVSQMFKDAFDENFVDFLLALRIGKAKQLLTETGFAQQEIAQQVGYSNSITFGRMFKRIVGVTPGDYRKRHEAIS